MMLGCQVRDDACYDPRMTRMKISVMAAVLVCVGGPVPIQGQNAATPRQSASSVPTFTKDVAPILYKHCASCHRRGEIAPMSLITYEDARPWAKAIAKQVGEHQMPPWHADAPAGTFHNERI